MATRAFAQHSQQSASDLAFDMYHSCLKDFSAKCVQPKAMRWFNEALKRDEILITDQLSIVRTAKLNEETQQRALDADERMFNEIDNFLATHALRIKAPEYFQSAEARSMVPDFLLNNALTQGAVVPLAERDQDHHLDIPHHVDHIEHLEHAAPAWDPHGWARSSSQENNHADAQDMAFAGQNDD
ncbi:hypothetical protein EVAR_72312_1 [Eumeta japonica]|uniref:Uncharacterized protein n=1 Tax=Eumeta variegata TaxID=151549 RepID=A0A4C1TJY1_EUMVA|nr:hypothetical protein EVAR_72312_1 [Eumeta japonica]